MLLQTVAGHGSDVTALILPGLGHNQNVPLKGVRKEKNIVAFIFFSCRITQLRCPCSELLVMKGYLLQGVRAGAIACSHSQQCLSSTVLLAVPSPHKGLLCWESALISALRTRFLEIEFRSTFGLFFFFFFQRKMAQGLV